MTKKEKARKKRNRILLIVVEILVLCVMGLALYMVTKTDKMELYTERKGGTNGKSTDNT